MRLGWFCAITNVFLARQVRKDNDFTTKIYLRPEKAEELISRLENDADFLCSQVLTNYRGGITGFKYVFSITRFLIEK